MDFRTRVLSLFGTHAPSAMGLRYAESGGRVKDTGALRERFRIEGVLLEAASHAGLKTVAGPLATLTAALGTDSAKKYLGQGGVRGVLFPGRDQKVRESILAAVAAL